jgi:hypothetical protein
MRESATAFNGLSPFQAAGFSITKIRLPMPLIRRSLQLWVLVAGHVFAALFVKDLGYGLDQIDDAHVKNFASLLKETHS